MIRYSPMKPFIPQKPEPSYFSSEPRLLEVNRKEFVQLLKGLETKKDVEEVREGVRAIKEFLENSKIRDHPLFFCHSSSDILVLREDVLLAELEQILHARTLSRASYYLKRLRESALRVKKNRYNDLNLSRWKEYEEILTDSLWIFPRRDTSATHLAWYWGNFIPQIPRQMLLRYTRKGEWVLDPFVGSGTTLIECQRLGRNGIGIELNPEVAQRALKLLKKTPNPEGVATRIIVGDSRNLPLRPYLHEHKIRKVQLLILHPPYHDIIQFSLDPNDLSNAPTLKEFLLRFGEVVDNTSPYLEKGRFLVLVIGDKYSRGEWIPLGFYTLQEVQKRGFTLKSIVVKNFEETRGKRSQRELWRYRALANGFYVFKHEYVMLFQKRSA